MADSDDKDIDYLHPEGKPKLPPRNKVEKEHLRNAKQSEKLVDELRREQEKESDENACSEQS
ncbi:MAG TPA: hypothetical protein V6C97_04870 [Oculatellaceae cyanobacterium]